MLGVELVDKLWIVEIFLRCPERGRPEGSKEFEHEYEDERVLDPSQSTSPIVLVVVVVLVLGLRL
jgi:hypothetical protein